MAYGKSIAMEITIFSSNTDSPHDPNLRFEGYLPYRDDFIIEPGSFTIELNSWVATFAAKPIVMQRRRFFHLQGK